MDFFKAFHDTLFVSSAEQQEEPEQVKTKPEVTKPANTVQIKTGIPGLPHTWPSAPASNAGGTNWPTPTNTVVQNNTVTPIDSNLLDSFLGMLREKFATNVSSNLLEMFASNLEAILETNPEEGNRYRAAFRILEKQLVKQKIVLTPGTLISSLQGQLLILETETAIFRDQVAKQKATEVETREQQIVEIQKEIDALNLKSTTLTEESLAAQSKLNSITVSFDTALATLQQEIGDQTNKMKIYLPIAVAATTNKKGN